MDEATQNMWRSRFAPIACALSALFYLNFAGRLRWPGKLNEGWSICLVLCFITVLLTSGLMKRSRVDYFISVISLSIVLFTTFQFGVIYNAYNLMREGAGDTCRGVLHHGDPGQ